MLEVLKPDTHINMTAIGNHIANLNIVKLQEPFISISCIILITMYFSKEFQIKSHKKQLYMQNQYFSTKSVFFVTRCRKHNFLHHPAGVPIKCCRCLHPYLQVALLAGSLSHSSQLRGPIKAQVPVTYNPAYLALRIESAVGANCDAGPCDQSIKVEWKMYFLWCVEWDPKANECIA